jgi:hypothetical protein
LFTLSGMDRQGPGRRSKGGKKTGDHEAGNKLGAAVRDPTRRPAGDQEALEDRRFEMIGAVYDLGDWQGEYAPVTGIGHQE